MGEVPGRFHQLCEKLFTRKGCQGSGEGEVLNGLEEVEDSRSHECWQNSVDMVLMLGIYCT